MRSAARNSRHQSESLRHVATLSTGSAAAQLIALILVPVLTRLYKPDDFGIFALYSSVVGIFGVITCWRYEFAISLPDSDSEAASLVAVSVLAALATSFVAAAVVLTFAADIVSAFGNSEIQPWLWVLPLHLLVIGLFNSISYWAARTKEFRRLSLARIGQTTGAGGTQVLLGSISTVGPAGLILGSVFGNVAAFLLIATKTIRQDSHRLFGTSWSTVRTLALRYWRLAVFAIPTTFLNAVSNFALPLLVAYFFGAYAAGIALLAQRLVLMPLSLVVSAIWQVTHAQIARMPSEHQRSTLSRIHLTVSLLIAFPLACIAELSQYSEFFLGSEWADLRHIMPAIVLMAFVNSVSNSTSYFAAFGEFRAEVVVNVLLVTIRIGLLIIGAQWFDAYAAISFFAVGSALLYFAVNVFWGIRLRLTGRFILNLLYSAGLSVATIGLITIAARGSLLVTCLLMAAAGVVFALHIHRRLGSPGLALLSGSRS